MKIRKGSVAIYILALILVTAGYWTYISKETETLETVSIGNQNTTDEHLGDATLVSNNELIEEENKSNTKSIEIEENDEQVEETATTAQDEYFQESKLARDTMYSQTLETYTNILNNSNVSEEQKAVVTQEITELNEEKNAIMICENLLLTKGFDKCVIFVNIDSISVIIGIDELKADEIAQIQNIISREMNAKIENIHIMTKKP